MGLFKLVVIFPLLFLSSCTQNNNVVIIKHHSQPQISSQEPPAKQDQIFNAKMGGEIFFSRKVIRIIGHSNLKKGTILVIKYNDQSLGKVKVDQKGKFYASYVKPHLQKHDHILILLKPELQPKNLQSIYGKRGGNLRGEFTFSYKKNQKLYKGLKGGLTFYNDPNRYSYGSLPINPPKKL